MSSSKALLDHEYSASSSYSQVSQPIRMQSTSTVGGQDKDVYKTLNDSESYYEDTGDMSSEEFYALQNQVHPKFKFKVFLREFLAHMFHPFSIPIMWFIFQSKPLLYNQNILIRPEGQRLSLYLLIIFFGHLAPLVMWATLCRYVLADLIGSMPDQTMWAELLFAVSGLLSHRFVVAVKYAYYSDDYLEAIKHKVIPHKLRHQLELSSWIQPTNETLLQELTLASKRQNIDLWHSFFTVKTKSEFCKCSLDEATENMLRNTDTAPSPPNSTTTADGKNAQPQAYTSTVDTPAMYFSVNVLTEFLDAAEDESVTMYTFMINSFSLLLALLPTVSRIAQGEPVLGHCALDGFCIVSCFLLSVCFWRPMFFYAMSALVDFRRSRDFMRVLSDVVSIGKEDSWGKDGRLPRVEGLEKRLNNSRVDLSIPNNVSSWYNVRRVVLSTGLVFRKRLHVALLYLFVISMINLITIVLGILTNPNLEMGIAEYMNYVGFILFFTFFFSLTGNLIWYGHQINKEHLFACQLLRRVELTFKALIFEQEIGHSFIPGQAKHAHTGEFPDDANQDVHAVEGMDIGENATGFNMSRHQKDGDKISMALLKQSLSMIDTVTRNIRFDWELVPATLFGFTCSTELLSAIAGLLASGLGVVASVALEDL